MKVPKISEETIRRLSVYSRFLDEVERKSVTYVSSGAIAEGTGSTSAQVRKDLACFGEFGVRGVGYDVARLNKVVKEILGLTKPRNVILIGAGNLGSALSRYSGFQKLGFQMVAAFDNDLNKVGLTLGGLPVYAVSEMPEFIHTHSISIAIVAVPAQEAQRVADLLAKTEIQGILNFAPIVLNMPQNIEVRNVDLTVNLEVLTYKIESRLW